MVCGIHTTNEAWEANSVKEILTPQKLVSPPNVRKCRIEAWLLRSAPAILVSTAVLLPFGSLAMAQEASRGAQAPQAQTTAARSKPSGPAAPQWPARSNDPNGSTLPLVTYEDGQLTINANNSNLSDILFAVHACTGADIDLPNNTSSEKVTAQLGPGPARKVLSDLLGWSNFDYIIQGSDTDALAIHSVTLMVRVKSATGATAAAPAEAPTRRTSAAPVRQVPEAVEPQPATLPDVPQAQSAPPDQPVAAAPDGLAMPEVPNKATGSDSAAGGSSNAGKSAADMIQELQQMYQQRRALQVQQNANPGQKVPGT
jgi:hypothetical protein